MFFIILVAVKVTYGNYFKKALYPIILDTEMIYEY